MKLRFEIWKQVQLIQSTESKQKTLSFSLQSFTFPNMELFWMRKRRLMANTFNYSGLFAAHNDTCVISWFNLEKDQFLIQSESGATHSHSASSHWIWNCRVLSGEILKMYILSLQGHDWCKKGASTKTARLHPATILKVVFPIWRRKILFCRVNNISTRLYAVIYVDWRLGKKTHDEDLIPVRSMSGRLFALFHVSVK